MKINKLSPNRQVFRADVTTKDPLTGEYKDPLMHWPLRGAAYTNEIGEALRPLIGEYATLSWVPALLYIGADIYDKYKNDKTEYSPNSKRALKQAIFQGMASILLPLVAVKAGQNLFSLSGYVSGDKITLNSKEEILKLAEDFVKNGNLRAYNDKDAECIAKFKDIVSNKLDYNKNIAKSKNFIKKFFIWLEGKLFKDLASKKQSKIDNYAEKTIMSLIELRKKYLNPSEEFIKTQQYRDYTKLIENGQTKSVAIKSSLVRFLNNDTKLGRVIKTSGGFLALALAVKPIDNFVENVLIGKIVSPTLEKNKTR